MKIIKAVRRKIFTWLIRRRAMECGKSLRVNHWSIINCNTVLKNNVNFNGMKIIGGGYTDRE